MVSVFCPFCVCACVCLVDWCNVRVSKPPARRHCCVSYSPMQQEVDCLPRQFDPKTRPVSCDRHMKKWGQEIVWSTVLWTHGDSKWRKRVLWIINNKQWTTIQICKIYTVTSADKGTDLWIYNIIEWRNCEYTITTMEKPLGIMRPFVENRSCIN